MNLKSLNAEFLNHARQVTYAAGALLLILIAVVNFNGFEFNTFAIGNATGYLSFTFLSLSLIVSPVLKIWPKFELNPSFFMSRRALGVNAFAFAAIHFAVQFTFIFQSSFEKVIAAIAITSTGIYLAAGLVALLVLFILAITSTDWAVAKMGKLWYKLHLLTYLAYVFIFVHALKIGADFQNINAFSMTFLLIAALTVALEIAKIWKYKEARKTTS